MAIDLTVAAQRVRAASTLPTREQGAILPYVQPSPFAPGWNVFAAQSQLDLPDDLRYPNSRYTYNAMERVPQIAGLLASVYLPIRHMQAYVDPRGTTGTVAQEIAEDFGLPLEGNEQYDEDGDGVDYDEHLRLALLAIAHGHKVFEQSGVIEGNGPGAKYRLRSLYERPNETLQDIYITAGGDLVAVRVPSAEPDIDGPFVDLPAEHLLYYCWDRRGGDWTGRPLLYGCYQSWLLRDELVREDAVMVRRFGGIPWVETTEREASNPKVDAEAAAMAEALQSGDGAGVNMPWGKKLHLAGVEGTLPKPLDSVRYHDQQMARVFMQSVLELGQTPHGSRAMSETFMDHFTLGLLSIRKTITKTQMQLVRRIVEWNYGPGTPLPHIRFRDDEVKDLATDALVSLVDSGVIVVDDDLEEQIRKRGNLVPRNPSQAGRIPPADIPAVATPKNAAASRRKPEHDHGARRPTATSDQPEEDRGVDHAALDAAFASALALLKPTWAGVQAGQIDDLVAQIAACTSAEQVAGITPTPTGAEALTNILNGLVEHGAQTVADEAATQGVLVHLMAGATAAIQLPGLTMPSLDAAKRTIAAAASATVLLLSRALGTSAASKATSLWGQNADPVAISRSVADYLHGLAGTTVDYEMSGLATQAQNEGRFVALEGAPDGTVFIASEQDDESVCEPCVRVDGTEYASMSDARLDYPAGYYRDCEGGKRCRGTVLARFKAPE